MFETIYSEGTSAVLIFAVIAVAVVGGITAAFIFSLKMRSGKGFFTTIALLPAVVAATFIFLNIVILTDATSSVSGIAAVMLGMGLIRFRSAQGTAEEMLALFSSVAIGVICGLGYVAYGIIFAIALPLIYVALSSFGFLKSKMVSGEKLLKITIPETLEYNEVFDSAFGTYLKEYEQIGVKTTGMGSMFRLAYRIVMKDVKEEKELIDDLRTKNGNLEVSVLPYVEELRSL